MLGDQVARTRTQMLLPPLLRAIELSRMLGEIVPLKSRGTELSKWDHEQPAQELLVKRPLLQQSAASTGAGEYVSGKDGGYLSALPYYL